MAVFGQRTAGHDDVDMRMRPQGLAPGVQYAVKPDLSTQPPGVFAEGQQGFCGAVKKQVENQSPVVRGQGDQVMRQGENNVIIRHRKDLL